MFVNGFGKTKLVSFAVIVGELKKIIIGAVEGSSSMVIMTHYSSYLFAARDITISKPSSVEGRCTAIEFLPADANPKKYIIIKRICLFIFFL